MRIALLGGLRVEHDGRPVPVSGVMQLSVLFRLAVDAGTSVSYRAISEDVWGLDAPENTRAALQSIVSRLRSQLPPGSIESIVGGYRLNVARTDVDALAFTDLVAESGRTGEPAPAARALELWAGEPWAPSENFDWFVRDLTADHARAVDLAGAAPAGEQGGAAASGAPVDPVLPAQLTTLVGRELELATIADQLAANRLVTIIGTGGAGKTRLALETATGTTPAGTALLVELAPVGPSEVLGAVLTATGRELRTVEASTDSSRTRVLEALAGRDVLLVLDNCEHVIDAAAGLAHDLLEALPRLRILATSREPLGVPGEAFVGLGSLPHPTEAEIGRFATEAPNNLTTFAAVELFSQRALSARGRSLGGDDIVTAARICARLDGLPLAIELAAAKLRTMEPHEVLTGLDDRFTLLTGGYRTAMPRHQTLRAMIDWSWSLLDDDERRALLGLSVFPAGVGVTEARTLAAALGLPSAAVFDSLVDRSLLQRTRGRFRELETIREYGIERVVAEGRLGEARSDQARYMMQRAAEVDRRLRGPGIMQAIAWFDDEEDNLSAALRYSAGVPLPDVVVRLTIACAWYWVLRDRNEEAATWLGTAAGLAPGVEGDEAQILALVHPLLEGFTGNEADADDFVIERLSGRLKLLLGPLKAVQLRAGSHEMLQLLAPGLTAFAEAAGGPDWFTSVRLPHGEDLGLDPWPTAVLHVMTAAAAQNRGAIAELGEEAEIALRLFGEVGDLWGTALSKRMLAEWLTLSGDLERALEFADASTEILAAIMSSPDFAREQGLSIQLLWRLGRGAEARERIEASVRQADAGGDPRVILQIQLNALVFDVATRDVLSAARRIIMVDEVVRQSRAPIQATAIIETAKAAVARERGEFAVAEVHLRTAAEVALRSRDQPIIGAVALSVGLLALARGDVATAVRAVDFSTTIVGAYDATNPDIIEICLAADHAEIGRPRTGVPERPTRIEALNDLLA